MISLLPAAAGAVILLNASAAASVGPWIGLGLGVLGLAVLVTGWLRERRRVQDHFARTLRLQWLEEGHSPALTGMAPVAEELERLQYRPVGHLLQKEPEPILHSVYFHATLPIYALVYERSPGGPLVCRLESFLEGGGRLTTTSAADLWRYTPAVGQPPRLVQMRVLGTPVALDGQHTGTVRAWMSGKRQALPTDRDTLIAALERDHADLASRLERAGWLSFPDYLRALAGRPQGVLQW